MDIATAIWRRIIQKTVNYVFMTLKIKLLSK